jgi:hypothetical protein
VSVTVELWTRETGDLRPLLPRSEEWTGDEDLLELADEGEGWLVTVAAPEEADVAEAPPEIARLDDGLRYRIAIEVEPSAPGPDAWELVRSAMESIGAALGGGASLDPDTGHATRFGAP